VPKGTPKDIVAKLNEAIRVAIDDPTVQKRYAELGLEPPAPDQRTPEALRAHQKAEVAKWWPVIKAANVKP
jgi:tripartite-type tricarboxylate transporter receptor subunit TctC